MGNNLTSLFAPTISQDQVLNTTDRRGYVQFTIKFWKYFPDANDNNDFSTPIELSQINYTHYDIDGIGDFLSENPNSYYLRETGHVQNTGNIVVSANSNTFLTAYDYTSDLKDWIGFASGICPQDGTTKHPKLVASIKYGTNQSSITIRMGYDYKKTGNSENGFNEDIQRLYASEFKCFSFPAESTLPVSFGEIAVKQVAANAEESWATLSEFNNSYFLIERSNDAVNFIEIGKVASKGNSSFTQHYNFNGAIGLANSVIYYRIKQVDTDGASSYSKTVALRLGGSARISNYTAYPNPFSNNIKLQIDANAKEDVMIRINNLMGQTLLSKHITLQAGNNIVVFDNLQQLHSGIYMLEVIGNDGKHVQRLIKN